MRVAFELIPPRGASSAVRCPKFRAVLQPPRVGAMTNNLQRAVVPDRLPTDIEATRSSCALIQLEKRIHSNGTNQTDHVLMQLDLPDTVAVCDVGKMGLPTDWATSEGATQALGVAWLLSGSSLDLWVPSLIERSETNLLINPAHPSYTAIRLTADRDPFKFDRRLF